MFSFLFLNWKLLLCSFQQFFKLWYSQRCFDFINVVKLDVGKKNIVSMLSNAVNICVEIDNIDSKFNVVSFNVDKHNVVSTLIWRCVTFAKPYQPNNNVKTTVKCLLGFFIIFWKESNCVSALSTVAFYFGVAFRHQILKALIVSLAKACPSPCLIWYRMKACMSLDIGWSMLNDTHKWYKLSSNIPLTFIQNFV